MVERISCRVFLVLLIFYNGHAATFKFPRVSVLLKKFPASGVNAYHMSQELFQEMKLEFTAAEQVVPGSPERSPRIPRNIGNGSAEPVRNLDNDPEPAPDWPQALKTWGKAWDLHIYLFVAIYILLAATAGIALVYDVLTKQDIKGLKLTLYLTLVFIGCSRAVILFVDPYSSRGTLNYRATYITWSSGFPSILAALGLLLLVFMDVTKMDLVPPRFQKLSAALGLMVFNFLVNFITDLTILLTERILSLIIICRVYFLTFGLILAIGFLSIGFRFSRSAIENIYGDTGIKRLRILAFVTSALNLLFLGIQVYSFIQFDFGKTPRAWPWYAVQTLLRTLEVIICFVMFCILFNHRINAFVACWRNPLQKKSGNAVLPFVPETLKSGH